jgi:hypothetical protein
MTQKVVRVEYIIFLIGSTDTLLKKGRKEGDRKKGRKERRLEKRKERRK